MANIIRELNPTTAYIRTVHIEDIGGGEFKSNAWSIHRKTKESFHRGCAVHPDLPSHAKRADDWVNRKEEYFF